MKTSASSRRGSFREIEHTADLGIEITAADLPALFAVAGEALFSLIVQPESVQASRAVAVSATGSDLEDLLHAWLRELLAHFNINDFVARSCEVTGIGGGRVEGIIDGNKTARGMRELSSTSNRLLKPVLVIVLRDRWDFRARVRNTNRVL
jgi:SHS2 domain-containing protein